MSIIGCDKEPISQDKTFTGTLVKQGICLNYVIQVNDSDFPQELIEKSWIDEFSNIEYKNVFALESVCDFSEEIKEGSSFEFIIDNKKDIPRVFFCTIINKFPIKLHISNLKKFKLFYPLITVILIYLLGTGV